MCQVSLEMFTGWTGREWESEREKINCPHQTKTRSYDLGRTLKEKRVGGLGGLQQGIIALLPVTVPEIFLSHGHLTTGFEVICLIITMTQI